MYNWEPTLPIDVKYSSVGIEGNQSEHPFHKKRFDAVLTTSISMGENIHRTADENICSEQEKQRRNYNRRRHMPNKLKRVKKCFWRIKERWAEKVINFHLNSLAHSQFIWYQIKTFAP